MEERGRREEHAGLGTERPREAQKIKDGAMSKTGVGWMGLEICLQSVCAARSIVACTAWTHAAGSHAAYPSPTTAVSSS